MAYAFQLDQPATAGIGRVLNEEAGGVVDMLTGAGNHDWQLGEAHKGVQRIGALLELTRDLFAGKAEKRQAERYRDIERQLARACETTRLDDALALLGADEQIAEALRDNLQADARAAENPLSADTLESFLASLSATAARNDDLKFSGGPKRLASGLQRSYRSGRKALARAGGKSREKDFHALADAVRCHWRHMQLLSAAWPSEMFARVAEAKKAAELLDASNDLASLAARAWKTDGAGAVEAACASRGQAQRDDALRICALLFAERPEPFARRIKAYWCAARKAAGASEG